MIHPLSHLAPPPLPVSAQPWHAPLAFPRVAATRELLRARTRELALRAGRDPWEVTQSDYEQAKRELTGESEPDRQDALLDSTPPPPIDQIVPAGAPAAPGKTTPAIPRPAPP